MAAYDRVARLAELVGRLYECADLTAAAWTAVSSVPRLLDDGVGASVMTSHHFRPIPLAADSVDLSTANRLQAALKQGPAVDVLAGANTVVVDDLSVDPRWPRWSAPATGLGWRSLLAVQLLSRRRNRLGVLEFAATEPAVFTSAHVRLAGEIAAHLSMALDAVRVRENLLIASDAQMRVGQAMGMLMERYCIDADQAFSLLRRYSQDSHRRLRDIAAELLATRRLPAPQPPGTTGG